MSTSNLSNAFLPIVAVNGTFDAAISPFDRGFTYGDGLFETMRLVDGVIPLWPLHHQRLRGDCKRLRIPLAEPALLAYIESMLSFARERDITNAILKVVVTRGVGGRGYAMPDEPKPTHCISLSPSPEYPAAHSNTGVNLFLCEQQLGVNPALAGIKHLNKLEHILALDEWHGQDYAEGLLLSCEGDVVEATVSNVFTVKGGTLFTPQLNRCGVSGVMRQLVMSRLASQEGVSVQEKGLSLEDVLSADEVFLTNSVFGIWPVIKLAKSHWDRGSITRCLQRALDEYLKSQIVSLRQKPPFVQR